LYPQAATKNTVILSQSKLIITCEAVGTKALVRISGRISEWNNHAEGFKAFVDKAIADGVTHTDIHINSPGGDCFQANEIGNEIDRLPGTTTAILGALCASAGTYIACRCSKVIAAKNTQYMIHKPMGGAYGNFDEITAYLKALKNMQDLYAKTYHEKTGMALAKIEQLWTQDFWMNAEEAKTKKFIDEIEGETAVTPDDIAAIAACGYKNTPQIAAFTPENKQPQNHNDMKLIIAALALAADATEAQQLAAIEALKSKAGQLDAVTTAKNELQAKYDGVVKAAKSAEIKAVLDAAEANKQILASERGFYSEQLESNFDKTKAHIEARPKLQALSDQTKGGGAGAGTSGEDRSKWTYADYQEKNPAALRELSENDEEKFNALAEAHYGK
jgi:ATP-dependent Clp protease protease subunit